MRCHRLTPGDELEFRGDLALPDGPLGEFCKDFSYGYEGIFGFRLPCHRYPSVFPSRAKKWTQ